jgi:tetratricopeptide (TPR) repeat protein
MTEPTLAQLGEMLRRLRRREARERGGPELTYRELAAKTGWSLGILSEYFAGKALPPTDRFDTLVRLLGATPAEQGRLATARDRLDERRRRPPAEAASAPPRHLPMDIPGFIGRAEYLAELDLLLESGDHPAVVVSGPAGVGKTVFAVHWAHRVAGRFPDGQLYANLGGFDPLGAMVSPAEAVRGFLDGLAVAPDRIPQGLQAMTALYRSLLAGRRILVLLDNARDADQVRPLLPGSSGCLVVVTSRHVLTSLVATADAKPLALGLLSAPEARALLTRRLGGARLAAEPEAAEAILSACAGLPLALSVVAARAATRPGLALATLAEQLRSAGLNAMRGEDAATDLRAVFASSYSALPAVQARLFRLLGVHPGADIATPAVASLAGLSVGETGRLIAELVRANLIVESPPQRYSLHDLLREYSAGLPDQDEREAALRRVLDHYLHTAHGADLLLYPHRGDTIDLARPEEGVVVERFDTGEEALRWFGREHDILVRAVRRAAETGLDAHAWQLAFVLATFLDRQGYWADWTATMDIALGAGERLESTAAQALIRRALGHAHVRQGHLDQARTHMALARDLACSLGDDLGQAQAHHTLGFISELQGDRAQAFDHARRALGLYRSAGQEAGQAKSLNAIGWFHAQDGQYAEAVEQCDQALTLLRGIDDRYGQAHTWDSLGFARRHLGELATAVACYANALDLFRELGDRRYEAEVLTHLGDARLASGDAEAAEAEWHRAVDILDQLGHTKEADEVRSRLRSMNDM